MLKRVLYGLIVGMLFSNFSAADSSQSRAGEGVEPDWDAPAHSWMPKDIDWRSAETISILLEDNLFTPDDIVLEAGKPYKLVLTNVSDRHKHDLVDLAFFHSVVFQKITIGGVQVNTPHAHSMLLEPNTSANLYLVPVKSGEFLIYCSIEGHREDGMEGYFTIVDKPEE